MLERNSLVRLLDMIVSFIILNLIIFTLTGFTSSTLKKFRWQRKEKKEINKLSLHSKKIEQAICQYNTILKSNFIIKIQFCLNGKKLGLKLRIKLIGDNLYIYLLRNYIYNIIDKILKDFKVRELIKDEILKVPTNTFSEFLELYNELAEELPRISSKVRDYLNSLIEKPS